jgi:hypothetical protein
MHVLCIYRFSLSKYFLKFQPSSCVYLCTFYECLWPNNNHLPTRCSPWCCSMSRHHILSSSCSQFQFHLFSFPVEHCCCYSSWKRFLQDTLCLVNGMIDGSRPWPSLLDLRNLSIEHCCYSSWKRRFLQDTLCFLNGMIDGSRPTWPSLLGSRTCC